jgi:hypothetical protein
MNQEVTCSWKDACFASNVLLYTRQYSEINLMHFLFNLVRIKGLYMFRALLVHLREALHKRDLVYYVSVMSVGCINPGAAN